MHVDALFDLSGDVAVVTGAGRGIGVAIARLLAQAGARVVCTARSRDEIERTAKSICDEGGQAIAIPCDVTKHATVEALVQNTIDRYGRLDIWVNNAGGDTVRIPLVNLPEEAWDATMDLNLKGPWICTRTAAPQMRDGGRILNISTRAAEVPAPKSNHYAAAKAGLNLLTAAFARELGPKIRVNGIMPGAVKTELLMEAMGFTEEGLAEYNRKLNHPVGRLGLPEDIAAAALFLCSPASAWITGQTLNVSGGL